MIAFGFHADGTTSTYGALVAKRTKLFYVVITTIGYCGFGRNWVTIEAQNIFQYRILSAQSTSSVLSAIKDGISLNLYDNIKAKLYKVSNASQIGHDCLTLLSPQTGDFFMCLYIVKY